MNHENRSPQTPADTGPELMIDAKESSVALRLPLYWFSDPAMRAKYRIPHYLLGGLVRYRMSELSAWAASSRAPQGDGDKQRASKAQDEGAE